MKSTTFILRAFTFVLASILLEGCAANVNYASLNGLTKIAKFAPVYPVDRSADWTNFTTRVGPMVDELSKAKSKNEDWSTGFKVASAVGGVATVILPYALDTTTIKGKRIIISVSGAISLCATISDIFGFSKKVTSYGDAVVRYQKFAYVDWPLSKAASIPDAVAEKKFEDEMDAIIELINK